MLRSSLNNWEYFEGYVESAFKLRSLHQNGLSNGEAGNSPDPVFQELASFFESLLSKEKSRSVVLSRLYLFDKISKEGGSEPLQVLPPAVDLVQYMIDSFGHKPCCFNDIRPYFVHLDAADRRTLLERIASFFQEPSSEESVTVS